MTTPTKCPCWPIPAPPAEEKKTVRVTPATPPPTPLTRTIAASHQRFSSTEQVDLRTALRQSTMRQYQPRTIPPRNAPKAE